MCIFFWETNKKQRRNALLDVELVARDSRSSPHVHVWEGMFREWGTPTEDFIYISRSA